jgi:hypothetical protein
MWKWFKWIVCAVGLFLFYVSTYSIYHYFFAIKFSNEFRQKVENALSSGIILNDERNDFVPMGIKDLNQGGKPNNQSPYNLGFNDIKSVQLGADKDYLYYKVQFWGSNPKKAPVIDGDTIIGSGVKLGLVDKKGMDLQVLYVGSGWIPKIGVSTIDTNYSYGATGITWPEDKRMTHTDRDSKVDGGSGTSYLMGAFPLPKMDLKSGQEVNFTVSIETESEKYDHAAVDVLMSHGDKQGDYITWKIGSNVYRINENIRNEGYN